MNSYEQKKQNVHAIKSVKPKKREKRSNVPDLTSPICPPPLCLLHFTPLHFSYFVCLTSHHFTLPPILFRSLQLTSRHFTSPPVLFTSCSPHFMPLHFTSSFFSLPHFMPLDVSSDFFSLTSPHFTSLHLPFCPPHFTPLCATLLDLPFCLPHGMPLRDTS